RHSRGLRQESDKEQYSLNAHHTHEYVPRVSHLNGNCSTTARFACFYRWFARARRQPTTFVRGRFIASLRAPFCPACRRVAARRKFPCAIDGAMAALARTVAARVAVFARARTRPVASRRSPRRLRHGERALLRVLTFSERRVLGGPPRDRSSPSWASAFR